MSFSWPASLTPQSVSWGLQKAGVQFRAPFAGTVEAIEFPGAFWKVSITLPDMTIDEGVAAASFFNRLAGGVERTLVPYWLRLLPFGTMRGSPTLSALAAQGALSLSIATTGTLKQGDKIGVGAEVFDVFADCSASGGVLVVPLANRVRSVSLASGSPVVWNSPTIACGMPAVSFMGPFQPAVMSGLQVDLEEMP